MNVIGYERVQLRAVRALAGVALCLANAQALAGDFHLAEAVSMALSNNAEVQVQRAQVAVARGQSEQAAGAFDFLLSGGVDYARQITVAASTGEQTQQFTTGYQVGGRQLLRNGVSIGMSLDASAVQDNAVLPVEQLGSSVKVGVTLNLPLLRGRGGVEVTAADEAARLGVLASRYALRGSVSQILYQTLLAYWDYSARVALHGLALNSEERSRELLTSNQKLVDASEKPRGDLVLLKADLADKVAARQTSALAAMDARTLLGRLLGLAPAAIGQLGEPADPLPIMAALPASPVQAASFSTDALARRPDLAALGFQIAVAQRQLDASHHQLLPKLDVELGVSYAKVAPNGGHYNFLTSSGRVQSGPSVEAKLIYEFPVQNRVASGVYAERAALLTQLMTRQRDLANGVGSGVESALRTLLDTRARMDATEDALALYEQAVSQEIIKQKNGISTLIDVVNVEARFENARVTLVQTQLIYANAMAKLRFETGTLLPAPASPEALSDSFTLDVGDLAGFGPLARDPRGGIY